MSFIAGQYTATLAGSTMGQIKAGLTVEHTVFKRLITGDNFGQTPQDAVFQGMQVFIQYVLLEYNQTKTAAAMWPYGSTYLTMGVVGRTDVGSSVVGQLILTAVSGTPASAAPASVTLPSAILAEGYPVGLLFGVDLREIPIRQRVYPNSSGVFGTLA